MQTWQAKGMDILPRCWETQHPPHRGQGHVEAKHILAAEEQSVLQRYRGDSDAGQPVIQHRDQVGDGVITRRHGQRFVHTRVVTNLVGQNVVVGINQILRAGYLGAYKTYREAVGKGFVKHGLVLILVREGCGVSLLTIDHTQVRLLHPLAAQILDVVYG